MQAWNSEASLAGRPPFENIAGITLRNHHILAALNDLRKLDHKNKYKNVQGKLAEQVRQVHEKLPSLFMAGNE